MEIPQSFRELAQTMEAVAQTSRRGEKVARLAEYLRALDDESLATACTFLTGAAFPAGDARRLNVGWAALVDVLLALAGTGEEALHDAYLRHGDLGDVAEELVAARPAPVQPLTLAGVRTAFEAMAAASGAGSRGLKVAALRDLLDAATPLEAKYLVKIITSDLRVGVKAGLLEEAVAAAFAPQSPGGAPRALLPLVRRAHMLLGQVGEVAVLARRGRLEEARLALFHPFHFMLAETIFAPEEAFGPGRRALGTALLVEDKYDGIRAQVHAGDGRVTIFSRTLDDVTASFPELLPALRGLAGRYIVDGEILAWRGDRPLPFSLLQQRLRRKEPGALVDRIPVVFFVFDLLHLEGTDLLAAPLADRRRRLEELRYFGPVRPSLATVAQDADHLARRFREARARGNEGLVVKRLDSAYAPGRRGRQWMKWKEELASLDVVVVAAEHGHGRRAGVLSDVTFAVRDGGRLATIGKAYSGLTDREIAELTRWFHAHTVADLGRVKVVQPEVVLEVAFDAVTRSGRHDSGFALRFPRIKRWRQDKTPAEVNTLDDVRRIYERQVVRPRGEEERVGSPAGGAGGGGERRW
ncbi:MAG: ATP-dependent DNA ligase [Armatimonadota bacterium]|nr:ATP-dependent DNA ligase [Armatimonadota bacterium]MDR7473916.1 ATP-dependent DNA ligase [Armatimonadota bacterium]